MAVAARMQDERFLASAGRRSVVLSERAQCRPPCLGESGRFTSDFQRWLAQGPFGAHQFARSALPAFGGREHPSEELIERPVVFVHGNQGTAAAWSPVLEVFLAHGFRSCELFAASWGGEGRDLPQRTHSREALCEIRGFLEAVLRYTEAPALDVISHSMGVTLARKAVKGGPGLATDGAYDLGPPLTASVETFLGIAGGNLGLLGAFLTPTLPASNALDGFFPGVLTPLGVVGQSRILQDINADLHYEGRRVLSLWSPADEVVSAPVPASLGLIYGRPTARIPGQDGERVLPWKSHRSLLRETAKLQYRMLQVHT